MNIQPIASATVRPVEGGRAEASAPKPRVSDDAVFSLDTLKSDLAGEPAVRASEVARGRELFNDVMYPPAAMMRSISKLVASYIQKSDL